tara:strand:- start:1327 stop:2550 length:1224 start_codon:yes stop_codon:yes gene_type:complete
MAFTRNRDLRLPEQRTKDHPSNFGSSSYYAHDRGWVPNKLPSNYNARSRNDGSRIGPRSWGMDPTAVMSQRSYSPNNKSSNAGQGIMNSSVMQDLKDSPKNAWGDLKNMFGSFKPPSFMLADSIVQNQAQHQDLDQYFEADDDDWRNTKNARFFEKQGFEQGLDWKTLSNRNNPDRDISGLSQQGKQAMNKFNLAGITNQVMAKFMDPEYKFGGNEAWLRSQSEDKGKFDEGMSLIKNARDTSELHDSIFGTPDMAGETLEGYEGNLYDREKQIKDLEDQTFYSGPRPKEKPPIPTIPSETYFGGNERFEEQLAAEQPLPWEDQRQKMQFRKQKTRGGRGPEWETVPVGNTYPYGEDFQDSLEEFWDINPQGQGVLNHLADPMYQAAIRDQEEEEENAITSRLDLYP